MSYLILSIILMVVLNLIFKMFSNYNVRNFHAIIINYLTCFIVGTFFFDPTQLLQVYNKPWIVNSVLLSIAFILGFNVLAYTIKYFGISLGTVMQRMSLVLTAVVSIKLYQESVTLFKLLGIAIGVISIFLVVFKSEDHSTSSNKKKKILMLLPILTLLSSTIVDSGLQFTERYYLLDGDWHVFNATLFMGAGIIGSVFLLGQAAISGQKIYFSRNEIVGGILLGVPNYFSIHYLVQALNHGFEGSFLFPVMNISIILISVLLSLVFFQEKLTIRQGIGIVIACVALLFLSISN